MTALLPTPMTTARILHAGLRAKLMSADEAALFIHDGDPQAETDGAKPIVAAQAHLWLHVAL